MIYINTVRVNIHIQLKTDFFPKVFAPAVMFSTVSA